MREIISNYYWEVSAMVPDVTILGIRTSSPILISFSVMKCGTRLG